MSKMEIDIKNTTEKINPRFIFGAGIYNSSFIS